jgi:hypothetical protein
MSLASGTRLGVYEVLGSLGAGGPASVRGTFSVRELRRGRAEAKGRTR